MAVSFLDPDTERWVLAGQWFNQLAELASKLDLFRDANPNLLKRALLIVPSRALVANAVAWGYSKHALQNPLSKPTPRPISRISECEFGSKIQLTFPLGRGETAKQLRVGTLQSFQPGVATSKVTLIQDGQLKSYGLRPGVEFSLVPDFTPDGDYWESQVDQNSDHAAVLNFFNSQQNPMALVFTEKGAFQTELAYEFQEPGLSTTLGVEKMTLEEACRIDHFSYDQHAHFVNSWEHYGAFDDLRDRMQTRLDAFRTVILDGNLALEALAQKDAFRERFVLGVFESGRDKLQDRGASAFLGDAAYYELIEDFESLLGWDAPDGIRIWGWKA